MVTDEAFHRRLNKWADSIEKEFGGKVKRHPMPKATDQQKTHGTESTKLNTKPGKKKKV